MYHVWCIIVNIQSYIFGFRKKYNNEDTKVLFLAVSDDDQWLKVIRQNLQLYIIISTIQNNLGNHSDVRFGSDFSSQSVAPEDHVGFDLCVLASSDHTVITYGTTVLLF